MTSDTESLIPVLSNRVPIEEKTGIVSTRQKKHPLAADARGNETCLSTRSRVAFYRKGGTEKIVSLAV